MSTAPDSSGSLARSSSQSLFQIYYLGCTRVDRRCSSVVMPWIIEELKLKTQEMKFLWLTPGPDTVSYVADSGQELFSHSYSSILQCCIAVDGISFAYISRSVEDNKYYCHVFQALTYEEAELIMSKFKVHAREEVSIGSTISRSKTSDLPTKSSGLIFSSSLKHHPPDTTASSKSVEACEYHLDFLGKFEVPAPSSTRDSQCQTIDKIVTKLKETHTKKLGKSKRGIGTLIRKLGSSSSLKSSSHSSLSSEDVPPATSRGHDDTNSLASQSTPSLHSQESFDVSVRVVGSPEPSLDYDVPPSGDEALCVTEREGGSVESAQENGGLHIDDTDHPDRVNDGMDFDTIPELSHLQDTTVFQALSEGSSLLLPSRRVKLVFSGLSVLLISGGERIMKKSIRHIACCAQGQKEPDYLAFTSSSKEGNVKKYHCHLFLADSKNEAIKILESFKSVFVHALSLGMPAALCDSCPLQQLHSLCKSLEGVSTQVAQSRIQECLGTINETDYATIMKQYKLSEHADHEYTQIIILVGLIRQYYLRQQEHHTHPGTSVVGLSSISTSVEPSSSRLKLPALTRAKNAIASSIENLKNRPTDRGSRFSKGIKPSASAEKSLVKMADKRVTQNLNVRPVSPIFSKKTTLDTLMAPIPTTPVKKKTEEDTRRERTWSGYSHKSPRSSFVDSFDSKSRTLSAPPEKPPESSTQSAVVHTTIPEVKVREEKDQSRKKHTTFQLDKSSSPLDDFKTPSTPVRKIKSHRPRDLKHQRHSLTPPARLSVVSPLEKESGYRRTHRRATSYALTHQSWRQEIFESVNTPERRRGSANTEFSEDFVIIDPIPPIQQLALGGSWQMKKGSLAKLLDDSSPHTRARKRWRDAIGQQIILNRMETQNKLFLKASTDAELKRVKLCYSSPELDSKESIQAWSELLSHSDTTSHDDIRSRVIKGVSPSKRGEVWSLLAKQYQVRSESEWALPTGLTQQEWFRQLLSEDTGFEHSILVDLGRTFPNHPYFSGTKKGQASLRNVLHAYAVADTETGYCQGLSFVTGIILMHTKNDESAFELLYQLMTLYNYREMYFDNLTHLQMRLYQLSRLLHDFNPALYQHLRVNDITPFFYAAPWFLTVFASQFPIAFTARVFDMIFCDGIDFLLKVVLALLQLHEESILDCGSMESTCNYLKTALPEQALEQVEEIFETASNFDFGNRLETFEAEYHVMADLNFSFKSDLVVDDFPSVAEVLKKQNVALIEQLAICHACNSKLESMVETLQTQMAAQNQRILELETKLLSMQSTNTNQCSLASHSTVQELN